MTPKTGKGESLSMEKHRIAHAGLAVVLALVLLSAAFVCPLAFAAERKSSSEKLHLVDLSDVHLFDESLMADTEDWRREETNDLKKNYCNIAIIDKTLDSVRKQKPEVILINGDLTKDGEYISEKTFAAKLNALKKDLPKTHIYVINGNHDINSADATNYNTKGGESEPAAQTSPEQFRELYAVTYHDPTIIARYTPPLGAQAARARGDTVIGFEHHGLVHHSPIEGINMNKGYDKIAPRFADAGLNYLFTGHMHCDDIAKYRSPRGNDLWDIETGTPLSYPSAYRVVDFSRHPEQDGTVTETLDGKLVDHLGPVTYQNPVNGKIETIDDITEYNRANCITPEWVLSKVENPVRKECKKLGIPYSAELEQGLNRIGNDLLSIPVDDSGEHTLIQWANNLMQGWFAGTDNGRDEPAWFQQGTRQDAGCSRKCPRCRSGETAGQHGGVHSETDLFGRRSEGFEQGWQQKTQRYTGLLPGTVPRGSE